MLIFLTKIRNFIRMLTRPFDKFLLERLILYTISNTVSQQVTIGLSRLTPFELQDIGTSAQDSEQITCIEFDSSCLGKYDISWFQTDDSYFTLTCGLFGTPPGVLTCIGTERSPSPFLVNAATCTEYLVSGCNPVMFTSSTPSSCTSRRIGSFSRSFP